MHENSDDLGDRLAEDHPITSSRTSVAHSVRARQLEGEGISKSFKVIRQVPISSRPSEGAKPAT